MRRKLMITAILTGVLALLVGLGVYTGATASAAALSTENVSSSTPLFRDEVTRGRGFIGVDDEYLAEALGITTAELNTAQQQARDAALAAAVEQGLITQAQADAFQSDELPRPMGAPWSGWLAENGLNFDTFLAEALGISTDELAKARLDAQAARLDQAVADGDITEEQALLIKARFSLSNSAEFQASLQSAYEAALQQAVADGLITQEQADLLLQENGAFGLRGFGGPGMFGDLPGGHRPHGLGDFPVDPSSYDQSETP